MQEDTLNEAMTLYEKTQQARFNVRTVLKVERTVKNLSVKAIKDMYGLGNHSSNFSRGRGFQRTPKDLTLEKQLMKQLRNRTMRFKATKKAKKAEQDIGLTRSSFNGQKVLGKVVALILKNPTSWIVLLVLFFAFLLNGATNSTQRPATVQGEEDLTALWTYLIKLDT